MKEKSLTKNDKIELEITGYTSEGSGVGHVNGQAVFVSGAAQGDTVECIIIKAKPNYAIGKMTAVIKASPDRVIPDCAVFPRCGGCCYRHISYEAEQRLKYEKVQNAFERIGHLDVKLSPLTPSPSPEKYRNKALYPVETVNGRLMTGFYAPFTHRVIDSKKCLLQPDEFGKILSAVARWSEKYKIPAYDETTGKGILRHIYIRKAFGTGEIMAGLVINGDRVFKAQELVSAITSAVPAVVTVFLNKNTDRTNVVLGDEVRLLYGKGYIEDILCGKKFRISPLSFYQVNHDAAQLLYSKAAEFALTADTRVLVDMYCGAGTIGLTMADKVDTLIGVEIVPDAVKDAKLNAKLNGFDNAEFICADAARAAEELAQRGIAPDTVILDPPRKGCDEELINTVAKMNPGRIVYVSCDPATLARDCAIFGSLGYTVKEAYPFDLFPRTVHVETVVLLSGEKVDGYINIDLDIEKLEAGS